MLISGKEKLERMRDGRAIYIGAERVNDVTRHPAFKNAAQTIAGLYDLKADPDQRELFTFEENGERYRAALAALPHPRGSRAPHAGDEGNRGRHLRPDRPLARPCRGPDHRARDEARAARRPAARLRREPDPLLRIRAQERSLSFVRGHPAVGHPQPRDLHRRSARRSDPAGGRRGRQRRHRFGHEDAGDRRGIRRRGLDRQSHRH